MRLLFFAACAALLWQTCVRAQGVKPDTEYGERNTFSVFADYSNDSSHMIIGQEENRKIGAIGIGYSLRLAHKRYFDFSYEPELRPFTVLRDPVVSGTSTVEVQGSPTVIVGLPASGPFSGPTLNDDCVSGTSTFQGITANGVIYTQTVMQQCGTRWSYLGGISPLGLRFGFAKRQRVQPFLVANGGFLAAAHDEPVNRSARFNFTFEVGGGVEFFRDHRHSFALDFRMRHMSNGYRGFYNPGIDNGVFRASYRFGR
ncbi:MAG TPA: acyloxyacyl hydrolase [Acidobacteriaceae bacterium]